MEGGGARWLMRCCRAEEDDSEADGGTHAQKRLLPTPASPSAATELDAPPPSPPAAAAPSTTLAPHPPPPLAAPPASPLTQHAHPQPASSAPRPPLAPRPPPPPPAPLGSLNDAVTTMLARSFEQAGFRTREEVSSMSREDVARVCAAAEPSIVSLLKASDLSALLLLDMASAGKADLCRLLLEGKASVESTNARGMTPLLLAAEKGHARCVECLLGFRADVHARAADGRTPLHAACAAADERTALLLIAAGASLLARAADGAQPLALLSPAAYGALLRQHGGSAGQGPPFPSDPSPWQPRPRSLGLHAIRAAAHEGMAVRLARFGARALLGGEVELGRDAMFPAALYDLPWSEEAHRFFPEAFRKVVRMLLMHASRGSSEGASLPPELMLEIVRRMSRHSVRDDPEVVRDFEKRVPKRCDGFVDDRPIMLRGWPGVKFYPYE
ncbi:hypothetical protein AB1Y20_018205 [Prymnesium parvum]|uniref:Uncharacterized protein n=1 Tax=Prymnesium parvum TaxID=97485 RepID=A0AB34JRA9_PRYPA